MRHRLRVNRLRSFATGCRSDPRSDSPWFDRLAFIIPNIRLVGYPDDGRLNPYLQERKLAQRFQYDRGARYHKIFFVPSQWLFKADLLLHPVHNQVGVLAGRGELVFNATRLFVALGRTAPEGVAAANRDLAADPDLSSRLKAFTLDGRTNLIPDELIDRAISADWPLFVEAAAYAIKEQIQTAIGCPYDIVGEGGSNDFLLSMPDPSEWNLTQVEAYHEYTASNATAAVRAIERSGVCLSREVTYRRFVRSFNGQRTLNGRSLNFGLGYRGASLAIYGKTATRIRTEVRYLERPLRICKIRHADFANVDGGLALKLKEVGEDCVARLALWFEELCRVLSAQRTEGDLISRTIRLVLALEDATSKDGLRDLGAMRRVSSMLISNHGISWTDDPQMQEVIRRLRDKSVIVPVSATRKRNRPDFRIAPIYAPLLVYLRRSAMFRSEANVDLP